MIENMTIGTCRRRRSDRTSARFEVQRIFRLVLERLELEDVRAFQVHLVSTGISWASLNRSSALCGSFTASRSARRRFPSGSLMRASAQAAVVLSDEVVLFLESVST